MKLFSYCLVGLLTTFGMGAQAEVCVQDDLNQPVCANQARRVLALAPHLTEIVDFVGGLDAVIAVDGASNYPERVNRLPKMANPWMLGAESILARKPDLVLVWQSGISSDVVVQLRQAGVPVFVSEPRSLAEVASTMRRLSSLLGTEPVSRPRIDDWLGQFAEVQARFRGSAEIPVFYQVWQQPLMTLGGQHVVSEIIGLCGGRNVFSDLPSLAAQVSLESVLKRQPRVLLASGSEKDRAQFQAQWARWPELKAVQNRQVYTIPQDILVRNGPRLIDAARRVCANIDQARRF